MDHAEYQRDAPVTAPDAKTVLANMPDELTTKMKCYFCEKREATSSDHLCEICHLQKEMEDKKKRKQMACVPKMPGRSDRQYHGEGTE